MTRAREAARLIGNNTFRLDSNNAVGFNSTTPDAMFDINHGLTVAGVSTFTGNVTMNGDLTVQGTTTTLDTIVQEVDLMNIQANTSTPAIGVTQSGAGSLAAFYDGTSEVVTVTSGGNIRLPDSTASTVGRIEIGDSQDLQLFHNGTHSYIDDSGTGNLYIRSSSFRVQKYTGEECARFNADGAVELYYDNTKRLETTGGGITVTGIATCDGLSMGDSEIIKLGAGDDLQIYHDGTDSKIVNYTGNTIIEHSNGIIRLDPKTSENGILIRPDAEVELFYDNNLKLETKSDGIDVTGEVQCDTLDCDGSGSFDNEVYINGSDATTQRYLNFARPGTGEYRATLRRDKWYLGKTITNIGNVTPDGSTIIIDMDGSIGIKTDTGKMTFGIGDDLEIYHNGTVSRVDNSVGVLQIRNLLDDSDISLQTDNGSGGVAEYVLCDGSTGAVKLNHYGNTKLETAGGGVIVTGVCTATDFNSTSDVNLKQDIITINNALEITNQLRGVRFNWIESGSGSYGVIAQELEEVLPELVSQGDTKTVNYNGIIGVLIEAVKELSARVEELENR